MADLVSVIVPVYNAAQTIQNCIESIINQSYTKLQIVVVDDGSTDSSLSICKKIANKDSRLTIVEKKNGGVSSARNCGIEKALGKYLMFLDSDDCFEEDLIKRYVGMMNQYTTDIIIGGINFIYADKHISLKKEMPVTGSKDVSIWNLMCTSPELFGYLHGKIFKKDIIDKYSIRFNEKMYAQEDLDFCLSYYAAIDNFYLTEYIGYRYYFEQGKRKPPYCDFMKNQLNLFNIAQKKCVLSLEAYEKIQERICGYIYMMLYETKNKREFMAAYEKIKNVAGIDTYLKRCRLSGENKYIVSWYLNDKYDLIYQYFKIRCFIKKILKKE